MIDKENDPLLFTYQSVHYILRPREQVTHKGVKIAESIPCEVQVRTLLQHAHAELTHDAIYKAKKAIQPKVHRTVAKSMALIETTDEFFTSVTDQLNYGPLEEFNVVNRLDSLYTSLTGLKPYAHKSSLVIWDEYEQLINESLVDDIQSKLTSQNYVDVLPEIIKKRYSTSVFYQQSVVLFIYWMLLSKKRRLLRDWPFEKDALTPLANDLGVTISS